jgi:hypothetical protein
MRGYECWALAAGWWWVAGGGWLAQGGWRLVAGGSWRAGGWLVDLRCVLAVGSGLVAGWPMMGGRRAAT